jgi:2-C-methyl-D-erythritol 2,4-cyclodiphosphate synthase/2-C-methyl-D-erythritol 4-phosphate cytidylyltransferase
VLDRTLAAFDEHPGIDLIVVAGSEGDLERMRAATARFEKVFALVPGGATRSQSVHNGLNALPADAEIVLVHDAARPLVSSGLISRVIEAVREHGAAVPGLPVSDTVKRADASGRIWGTVSRTETLPGGVVAGLTAVQTPQGARVSLLRQAYERFPFDRAEPTDEANLLEEGLAARVVVVAGDATNVKITRPEDLAMAEAHLTPRPPSPQGNLTPRPPSPQGKGEEIGAGPFAGDGGGEIRTGMGFDVHAFASPESGRRLFLGGVAIPHDRGLEGHSDADALLHAVCDALLGAAGLGDIGVLFPNTDPAFKDIASLRLLETVRDRIREAGWSVGNVDITLLAEAPKIMPYRDEIRSAIAGCLGVDLDRVNLKATTAEGLGAIGRREGIACWSIATLRRA